MNMDCINMGRMNIRFLIAKPSFPFLFLGYAFTYWIYIYAI